MTRKIDVCLFFAACCLTSGGVLAEAEGTERATPERAVIRVLDLEVVSTNGVRIGTNVMSMAEASRLMIAHSNALDVIAVHGLDGNDAAGGKTAAAVSRIARLGVPLAIVEKDGEYTWREQSGSDGVRTVAINSGQFAALRRLLGREKAGAGEPSGPVLKTTLEWDSEAGTHELKGVELGLFGERVWLMHEQSESDDGSGTLGIRIKKEW